MSIVYRSEKGAPLTYQEVDGNFSYLLSEIGRVEGLTEGSTAIRFEAQELTEMQQIQVRENIAAIDFKLSGLPLDLTATEREQIRLKLGIEEFNSASLILFKHIEIGDDGYEVGVQEYTRVVVDYYETPYDRVVVLDGTIDGQELIIRTGNFTAAPTVKINMNVLNENGINVFDITMDKNTSQRFYWSSTHWILI